MPISGRRRCLWKKGGVFSFQRYERNGDRIGKRVSSPVILYPRRFNQGDTILKHLASIVDFDKSKSLDAREVPLMRSSATSKASGFIDVVLANDKEGLRWYGLEIQAVYFLAMACH